MRNNNRVIARARKRVLQSSVSNWRTDVLVSLCFPFLLIDAGVTPARKEAVMRPIAVVACLLGLSALVHADGLPTGTWVRRNPLPDGPTSLSVEAAGSGRKLTYRFADPNKVMTIVTQLDGKDAPVLLNGQPTGQTMAIKRIDDRHVFAVVKFQGNEGSNAKSELSADGKVLKVENMLPSSAGAAGRVIEVEYWDKK